MFGVVWDYYSSNLKGKQYKQNTPPKVIKLKLKFSLTVGYLNRALNNPAQSAKNFDHLISHEFPKETILH